MVFVDDEGLEEQFLTEDDDTQNILDTTTNRVTTPVDTIPVDQVLNKLEKRNLTYSPLGDPERRV